jgi:beta-lactamase class A
MQRRQLLVASALLGSGCVALKHSTNSALEAKLYRFGDRAFRRVLDRRDEYGLQIIYTPIDQRAGEPLLSTQSLYGSEDRWFWPASLIKLPLAALTLETLAARDWPRSARVQFQPRPACLGEPTAMPGSATDDIARLIERTLIVSDNFAANALYDFLGTAAIQQRLGAMGYDTARITGRLAFCTPDQQRTTPAFSVLAANGERLLEQVERVDRQIYSAPLGPILRGRGYFQNDQLIQQPRDFSNGNHLALADVHQMLIAIMRPTSVPPEQRWALRDDDLVWLRRTLATLPRQAGFNEADYPDNWAKFLTYGDQKGRIPESVHIHNKIGQAFGYLSDCAYIRTPEKAFFLSAAIYVNADGIYNDDRYEYDSIGFPFLGQLGRILSRHDDDAG